jgi:hypothetical protein
LSAALASLAAQGLLLLRHLGVAWQLAARPRWDAPLRLTDSEAALRAEALLVMSFMAGEAGNLHL